MELHPDINMRVAPRRLCLWLMMAQVFISYFTQAGGPSGLSSSLVNVPIFKSKVIQMKKAVHRVSVGNPQISDILILRSKQLYIVGKQLGTTNVMVWDEQDKLVDVINIEVTHDLASLRQRLHQFLPGEEIGVQSSQGQLLLSGQSSSLTKMNTAIELASAYAEAASSGSIKSKVLNMLSIGGAQQVMLEVTVAEVSTQIARKLSANMLLSFNGSNGSGGLVNGTDFFDSVNGSSATTNLFGSYLSGDMLFDFALDVAKQNGLAKVLAEPNITALSGQKAEFLSGGEFPIPVPGENGTTIVFRDFGVGVGFVPTILDSGKINLNLKILVSELSNANSVGITPSGSSATIVVPSIVKRTSETTVELGDGQTLAISGLLNDTLRDTVDKVPGLGDLPILGQLFKSHEYISGQTELVIMVTPRLVRPFNKQGISLPTDGFVAVSDLEFYLLGNMTRQIGSDPKTSLNQTDNTTKIILPKNGGTEQSYGHEL
jgi:pilus assembly protein CpaC